MIATRLPASQPARYFAVRSSSATSRALCVGTSTGTPNADVRWASRQSRYLAFMSAISDSFSGRLPAGMEKFGVRWNTVSSDAWLAMTGIDWMPEEPVPMTPTRMPVKSTPSCGQWPVW
jgi:hypothetical protein